MPYLSHSNFLVWNYASHCLFIVSRIINEVTEHNHLYSFLKRSSK